MPTTQDMNQMTAEDRLSEVAAILATGLLRLRFRTRVAGESFLGDSAIPLEAGREDSPDVAHARQKGMVI